MQTKIYAAKGWRAAAPWIWLVSIGLATAIVACGTDRGSRGSGGDGGDGGNGGNGAGGEVAQSSSSAVTTSTASGGGAPPQGPCTEDSFFDQCCDTPWTEDKTCVHADPGCADVFNFDDANGVDPDTSKTGCPGGYACSAEDDKSSTGWYCEIPGSDDPSEWAPDCDQGQCPAGSYCAANFGGVCLKSCKAPTCPPGMTLATYYNNGQNEQKCVVACE
jgi:hypothetical protein